MADCVFCKIGAGEIAAKVVYRDEDVVAIEDLNPQAPTHLLVMPVQHYATLWEVAAAKSKGGALAARLVELAAQLGTDFGGSKGFRYLNPGKPEVFSQLRKRGSNINLQVSTG